MARQRIYDQSIRPSPLVIKQISGHPSSKTTLEESLTTNSLTAPELLKTLSEQANPFALHISLPPELDQVFQGSPTGLSEQN